MFLSYLLSMTAYVALLIILTESSRRNVFIGAFLNVLFIVMLFFSQNLEGWFRWAKSLSVLIPMLVVHMGRFASREGNYNRLTLILTGPLVLGFLCAILGLNILEASLKDIQLGNLWNGLCGLIMIGCIPFALGKSWRFDGEDNHVLVADLSLAWCLLYTTWNAAFVYSESPAYFAASCCILLVPEIYNVISVKRGKGNLWLHARIYTLMIHVSLRSFYDIFTPVMNSESWFDAQFRDVWGLVNFVLMSAYAVYWFLPHTRQKRNFRAMAA